MAIHAYGIFGAHVRIRTALARRKRNAESRTEAVAQWCEGYLHGMLSGKHDAALRERLGAEPMADIIKNMLQITRAPVDADDDEAANEEAFVEIVEYLRIAAQLIFEKLAELRPGQTQ